MSWRVVEPACLRISLGRAQLDAAGEVADPQVLSQIGAVVAALSVMQE